MPEIIKRKKAMSVNPLKASEPVGGSLATLGFNRAIPMLHGSQGCTAFAKVYFVRHFREPIPLQSTAMDQASSVMGADENVIEGLKVIAEKSKPELITVLTTGLSETQGTDIKRCVREFRERYPQFAEIAVVGVNTLDFTGSLETGYAATLAEIIDGLVPEAGAAGTKPGTRRRRVNVLAGSSLTPGDLDHLRDIIEGFGLRPVFVPDVSDSLDGHLVDEDFSPVTFGGTGISEVKALGDAAATLVIGASLKKGGGPAGKADRRADRPIASIICLDWRQPTHWCRPWQISAATGCPTGWYASGRIGRTRWSTPTSCWGFYGWPWRRTPICSMPLPT